MTSYLILTSAELAALGGLTESAPADRFLDLLGVSGDARTDPVRQAGLASLLVRDLVRVDGETIMLASGPEMIFGCLVVFRTLVQVGVVTGKQRDGFLILDAPRSRVLIAPRAHASYAVVGLDPATDLATQLCEIIAASLPDDAEALAAVVVADPDPDLQRSLVAGVGHGRWTLAATGSVGPHECGSRDEVLTLLVDRLRVLVNSAGSPRP